LELLVEMEVLAVAQALPEERLDQIQAEQATHQTHLPVKEVMVELVIQILVVAVAAQTQLGEMGYTAALAATAEMAILRQFLGHQFFILEVVEVLVTQLQEQVVRAVVVQEERLEEDLLLAVTAPLVV
jgi:hypothetical protein